ncbi:uncharacterized protein LOC131876615 [Cryptomeria japonica]|uniref:uncharacterized protein LOC131876615 n=1 Tax=Cryptomeria japonica TaxID=3369 RepID=UPI0027DA30F2|nr:uncharacterized protein LOC131876615 [Cryptomeria japonica]
MRRDFCQILKRLDHFMVSDNWFNLGQDFVSSILPFTGSDHFPIQFSIFEDRAPRKLPFKFEPMWFRDQLFLPSLKHWWYSTPFFPGSRMFQLVKKLGFLKSRIKDWNVMHFKNIFGEKARIQEEIEQLNESIVASGLSLAIYDKLKLLNLQLNEDDIAAEAVRFFKSLLSVEPVVVDDEFVNSIPPLVSPEDNRLLMAPFSLAELKEIVFSMHPEKAPEQGGFVPGRENPEGAIVVHEILHSISQQKVPAMILKLDMLKAYDHVNWQSLVVVLYRFGFSHSWVKWVFSCISSVRFSVLINEALSKAISNATASGLWSGIRVDGLPSSHSHCLFADDTLMFGMASMREARVIKKIISDYAAFFGQKAPSQVIKKIKVSLKTFLWSDNLGGQTKIPLLAWDKICHPKEVRGVGIRDLVIQNEALGTKLIWKLYANPQSKWAFIMLAKYLRGAPSERIFTATSLPKGSAFWKFLISCREVILPHLSWVVHNGKKAHFGDEVWNGHPALSAIRDWSPLLDILSDLWGPFVADYFNIVTSGPCLVAKWKDIPPLSINNDIILTFIEELRKRPLLFHMKEDSLVWVKNATGSYSVKEGYNSLVQAPLPSCWPTKLFWHPACLPKAGAFAWLAVQDKVLTGMRLDRLGITTVFPCVFCGYCMESMDHLFLLCPFASNCWYWLFDMLGWSSSLCPNLLSQFMSWPLLFPSSFYSSLWVVAPSLLIWNLWLERNSRIFKHKSSSLTVIIGKVQASISEVVLAFIHRNLDHLRSFSHWDNWVTWRWSLLHLMPSHGVITDGVSSTLKRKMAKWSPPLFPSFKLQFDGASKGNPGRSRVGVIIFHHSSKIIKAVGKYIGHGTNNAAEFQALSFGLDLAHSLNIKDIVIEGDSMLMAPYLVVVVMAFALDSFMDRPLPDS